MLFFALELSRPRSGDSLGVCVGEVDTYYKQSNTGFFKTLKSRREGGVRNCFQGCRFASFVRGDSQVGARRGSRPRELCLPSP